MIDIRECPPNRLQAWNEYVESHPRGSCYHLYNWRHAIEDGYGHRPYYLVAENGFESDEIAVNESRTGRIVGILPLFHVKIPFLGGAFVSLPFVDFAGVLSDSPAVERELINAGIEIGTGNGANYVELREARKTAESLGPNRQGVEKTNDVSRKWPHGNFNTRHKRHKVRMVMELPASAEALMSSFKSKLRSQIRKPMKEGLKKRIGGIELVDEFYNVFSKNMRDLGSPVHSKRFIRAVLLNFKDTAKIVLVHKQEIPIAAGILVEHRHILTNPWASALQEYKHLSPNMLLYWTMLEYGCENGFTVFDFGRSSPGSGTFKFKTQWGARPHDLSWNYIFFKAAPQKTTAINTGTIAERAVTIWKKLPVSIATGFGQKIRKYITL
jgi:FemAB-related protein (PEP-CTERM system-associated)